ncbi:MAG: Ger(x)C family spore germination protein [Candidatus Improbicoccus devescovinae]|nr:MAG: Ger(x)C family spore germination protein [Candidatus Improbicoccus devescovinae]
MCVLSKNKYKNMFFLLFMLLPMLVFSGCTEKKQLHEKLMIQGIGVDFENDMYNITVQAKNFKNLAGEKEPTNTTLNIKEKSVSSAIDKIPELTGLKPLVSQNLIIVIGEAAAKYGFNNFIDFFSRYHENRLNVNIRIAAGTAQDIFAVKINDKPIESETLRSLANKKSDINILKFQQDLKNKTTDPVLLVLRTNQEKTEIICEEMAIISDDKLVAILDKNETIGAQILRNVSELGSMSINQNNKDNICTIDKVETKIITEIYPNIAIQSNITVNALEFNKDPKYIESINEKIKENLPEKLTEICANVIKKTLDLKCDIFKFGKLFRNKYPNHFKTIQDDWKNHLQDIKYNIKININMNVIGTG